VQSVNSYIGLLRLLVAYDADDSALNITESGNGVHVPIHKYRTGSNKPCNISSGGKVTCFQQFFLYSEMHLFCLSLLYVCHFVQFTI